MTVHCVSVHNKCFFYSSELLLLLDVIWLKRGIFNFIVNSYDYILYSVLWIVTLLFLLRFMFLLCVPHLSSFDLDLRCWLWTFLNLCFLSLYPYCHVISLLQVDHFVRMLLIFAPSFYFMHFFSPLLFNLSSNCDLLHCRK